jgi:hypothetical protein
MRRRDRSLQSVVAFLGMLAMAFPAGAGAHVAERSGPFRVTMGWGEEPAYTGAPNFVEVAVTDIASGAAPAIPPGALDVEVSFGQNAATTTLPLTPSGTRGQLRATIVPTRPGTYAFHVTGTVRDKPLDVQATCSPSTFDCVSDASAVQFPAKDPSTGQLAERVERGIARAERADSGGNDGIAIAALIVAALALVTSGAALARRRAK